jgi:hypothetical protein
MTDGRIAADARNSEPVDSGDGGDVAGQRNPDTIQREIEQTRAELADTIDAIADRLSPKRVASRGAHAVRAQVTSVFNGNGDGPSDGHPATSVLDAPPDRSGRVDTQARERAIRQVAAEGGAAYTGTSQYAVNRRLRVDRVLLAVGATAAVAGIVVLWRSRRR